MTDKNDRKSLRERYMETQQNAFVREVDEEVFASRAAEFWNRWKRYIITVVAAVLAFTVIRNVREEKKGRVVLEQAQRFERIMGNPAISDDGRILELAEFAKTAEYGYRDIAYFDIHALQAAKGRTGDAIKTLETIIDTASDEAFRNLAILKLTLTKEYADTPEGMENSIRLLEKIKASRPFGHSAMVVLAMLYIRKGELAAADETLDKLLSEDEAPASLRRQAQNLKGYVDGMKAGH
jgi:hypothetical protein